MIVVQELFILGSRIAHLIKIQHINVYH